MNDEMTVVLGTVAMVPKGEYDSEAYYEYLNVVTYNGSSYMAKKASNGILPTNEEYWQLVAQKAARTYQSVSEMKADEDLKAGMVAQTLGYHEANDGGAAQYIIKQTTSNYYEQLNNSLKAELIITNPIVPEQFGAYGDGNHDDSYVFQNIVNSMDGCEIKLKGTYLLNTAINIVNKVGLTFKGIGENTYNTHFKKTVDNTDFFKLDNSTQIRFERIRFSCTVSENTAKGISFEIVDTEAANHRLNAIHIEECFFSGLYVGINVDVGSGYTYIKGNSFTSSTTNATHLKIGKNYDESLNEVSIGYLYIDNNAFISNEKGDRAIEIYNGHWIYITNNDIANYLTIAPIYITNEYFTNSVFIKNNSFFNVLKAIYAIPSANEDFSSIIVDGNNFLSINNSDLLHFESNSTKTIRTVNILNNHFQNGANVSTFVYINLIGINGFAIKNNYGQQDLNPINVLDRDHVIITGCSNGTTEKYQQVITAFSTNASSLMVVTPTYPMYEKPLLVSGTYIKTSDKNFFVYVDSMSVANQTVSLRARDYTGAGIGAYTATLSARFLVLEYNVMNNVAS